MDFKITGPDMRRLARDLQKDVTKTVTADMQKRADSLARRYSGKPKDEVLRAVNKELPGLDKDGAAEIAEQISQGNRVKFRAK